MSHVGPNCGAGWYLGMAVVNVIFPPRMVLSAALRNVRPTEMTQYVYTDSGQREAALKDVKKVVVKVGTRLLTDVDGSSKADRVRDLVAGIARLRKKGFDVLLVSSGAIGAGMSVLGTAARPSALQQLQAHAAVGQSRLMYLYETACIAHGFHCAQLLLTAADVKARERHLNVTSCLDALLGKGVLPIINENDSVSVDEIKFGDNDVLAALVASMVRADLTVLLTTVNGMHDRTAQNGLAGRRISVVNRISDEIRTMATGTDGNKFSIGGMATKLEAAELVTKAGEHLWIADGTSFSALDGVFAGRVVGTLFVAAKQRRMAGRKRFLAFFSKCNGDVTVDAGAEDAVVNRGRSLLPTGVTAVCGHFVRGDTVRILTQRGEEIGRGISNYSCDEIDRIKGKKTAEIRPTLGYEAYDDEIIHRSHLVLTG